ncbi:transposase [Comamonas testosteroni]|uniref:transposase n=1 Tax=Comamonas testosteroni TaxID=285 RepID=UPI003B3AAD4C
MTRSIGAGPALMAPRYQAPGGQETGPNPMDRGKLGSKRHIVVDARGIPLVSWSAARLQDVREVPGRDSCDCRLGRAPRKRPSKLHADKGYDYKRCRAHLGQRGIASRIARRGVESSERLGMHRWVVERMHNWFASFGKLRICLERRLDIHEAQLKLAAAIICARFVDWWC